MIKEAFGKLAGSIWDKVKAFPKPSRNCPGTGTLNVLKFHPMFRFWEANANSAKCPKFLLG